MEIRLITSSDAEMLSIYYEKNSSHFKKWEPSREPDYYSKSKLKTRLSLFEETQAARKSAYFIAVQTEKIIAHCSLTNIVYGPLEACHIGYGVDEDFEGKGLMTEVCKEALHHAFNNLRLHRVMAAYMPMNNRSGALLRKLGFSKEGLAIEYLKINGVWEDHILTSLLNPNKS